MINIVNPKIQIEEFDSDYIIRKIERAARTCYKTEKSKAPVGQLLDKRLLKTSDRANFWSTYRGGTIDPKLLKTVLASVHSSVLEHCTISTVMTTNRGMCYSNDTEVLTDGGWKYFKELTGKEKFITKDDDNNLLYLSATKVIKKQYDGDMLSFSNSVLSLMVTPNHNMWVFDYNKRCAATKCWRFIQAKDMNNKQYQFDVSGNWKGRKVETITIPAVTVPPARMNRTYGSESFDAKLFMEFLGIWVTDGYISPKGKKGSGRRISISQSKEKGITRIKEILDGLGLSYYRTGINFNIKCLPLWFKLKEWFIQDENYKKSLYVSVPDWIKKLNIELLNCFLKGVILGDGGIYDGRTFIYSGSLPFCKDLVEISLKIGKCASIRKYREKGHLRCWKDGRVSVCNDSYVVHIKDKQIIHLDTRRKKNTLGTAVSYSGQVYCVELPKYHKLFVMRDGKAVWCGNSHEIVRHRIGCAYSQECVSGDTLVRKDRTIKQLFDRESDPHGKAANININLKSVNNDNKIVPNKIKKIFYKGKDVVYEVTTLLGYRIKSTLNHEFQNDKKVFKKLSEFKVGDSLMVNGRPCLVKVSDEELTHMYIDECLSPNEIANDLLVSYRSVINKLQKLGVFVKRLNDKNKEKYSKNHIEESYKKAGITIKKQYAAGRVVWNKNLKECDNISVAKQAGLLRKHHHNNGYGIDNSNWRGDAVTIRGGYARTQRTYELGNCVLCGGVAKERHHIDRDPTNTEDSNIMSVCVNCHRKLHKGWLIGTKAHADTIVSIVKVGVEDVYDLEMCKPYHNYIANGFVVHNSSRYCAYNKDKFGNKVTMLKPYFYKNKEQYKLWKEGVDLAAEDYFELLKIATTEEARELLPNSTKTEIAVTYNINAWRHFFNLRASQKAHPEIRRMAMRLLLEFATKMPVLFNDIRNRHTRTLEHFPGIEAVELEYIKI